MATTATKPIWHSHAACRGKVDPGDLLFDHAYMARPTRSRSYQDVMRHTIDNYCSVCEVRSDCFQAGKQATGQTDAGLWGGVIHTHGRPGIIARCRAFNLPFV